MAGLHRERAWVEARPSATPGGGDLFCALHSVAPYCVPGGVNIVFVSAARSASPNRPAHAATLTCFTLRSSSIIVLDAAQSKLRCRRHQRLRN